MRVGLVTGIASAVYLVTLLAVPLLDRETDVLRAYPEDYTTGLAGALVRIGYVAVALMALAIAASVVRERSWLERIAAVLLVAGGAASVVLAWAPQRVAGGMLLIGVLALAVAPILVSIGGRRRLSPIIVTLGIFVTAGFVALIVLAPRELAGIANRSVGRAACDMGPVVCVVLPRGIAVPAGACGGRNAIRGYEWTRTLSWKVRAAGTDSQLRA